MAERIIDLVAKMCYDKRVEDYQRHPNDKCRVCGKAIYRRPSEVIDGMGKYCSRKCYGIICRKEVPCIICGTPVLSSLNKKTCGEKCAKIHFSNVMTGLARKRDGLKRPIHELKNTQDIRWRLIEIKTKCRMCGCSDERVLVVHHIDKNRRNNTVENLDLLCANCHAIVHYEDRKNKKKKYVKKRRRG